MPLKQLFDRNLAIPSRSKGRWNKFTMWVNAHAYYDTLGCCCLLKKCLIKEKKRKLRQATREGVLFAKEINAEKAK